MAGGQQTGGDSEERRGAAFYDEPHVFERYQEHREWSLNPNAVMEEPALLAELGDPAGLRVLDLGCGDARIGRHLLDAGAASYVGVDGSARMIEAAGVSLRGTVGEVVTCDIEDFSAAPGSVDLVISRMALHYIQDIEPVLASCGRWLAPAGRMVFTVVHPVITSHDARADGDEPRRDWVVDNYFSPGPRSQAWLGGTSRWYHRTIEDYVSTMRAAGFALDNLSECAPVPERFDDPAEFERRQRIPLVLLLAGSRAQA